MRGLGGDWARVDSAVLGISDEDWGRWALHLIYDKHTLYRDIQTYRMPRDIYVPHHDNYTPCDIYTHEYKETSTFYHKSRSYEDLVPEQNNYRVRRHYLNYTLKY